MDIRLVRIDDRLIHGQVATVWTKHTNVSRILVVSDEVAQDELRKLLLIQAAPVGVKVNVIPVVKLIELAKDIRVLTDNSKIMLLFTNPKDVRRVVDAGIFIDTVNVGGMSFQSGKRMITNAVAVDDDDIAEFAYLGKKNISIEIRKVVADSSIDLLGLLRKEQLIK
ncbi:PTS sugar transporter subunit IIB [Vagococcus vulneris]|uniref:PTS fructose transporter subunit IIB n=1 Tax=Vagococcus vulneris TaxID=1977869 RepID=A0A429ZYP6_9ENTE|nr:PTS sugar transporter subunit IIB [Vagococcus vulneris]RST99107.1 PTS fructose transporter subunit IIB [Vagococcus vulneris]